MSTPALLIPVSTGAAGTRQTLRVMAGAAEAGSKQSVIRERALDLISGISQRDHVAEAEALFNYVRDTLRFTLDPATADLIQIPAYTLSRMQGDCDDAVTLLASLLLSIGLVPRFVAIGRGNVFCHVYLEILLNRVWVPADPTTRNPVALGALSPLVKQYPSRMVFSIPGVNGLGLVGRNQGTQICYDSGGGTTTCVLVSELSDLMQYNVPGPGEAKLQAFFSNCTNTVIRDWLVRSLEGATVPASVPLAEVFLSGTPPWNTFQTTPPSQTVFDAMAKLYSGSGKASTAWCNSQQVALAWVAYRNATSINVWQSIAHVGEAVGAAIGVGYLLPAVAGEGAAAGAGTTSGGLAPTELNAAQIASSAAPASLAAPVDISGITAVSAGGLATVAPLVGAAGGGLSAGGIGDALATAATATKTALGIATVAQGLKNLNAGQAGGQLVAGALPASPANAGMQGSDKLAIVLALAGVGGIVWFLT